MLLQVCDRPEVTEIGIIQPIAEHETRTVTLLDHSDELFNNSCIFGCRKNMWIEQWK
ncbi:MAG: hypothetical protein L6263_07940 [Desulfobacteraceae bacterium]|nr:hypothetical protein [Pseudomonadota bacterium]MBU4415358.1 hypothetical protein [Pseudomonadota bacterium]MCG2758348.1 hypothetical protein [Desulfobacteraceae bacterium]